MASEMRAGVPQCFQCGGVRLARKLRSGLPFRKLALDRHPLGDGEEAAARRVSSLMVSSSRGRSFGASTSCTSVPACWMAADLGLELAILWTFHCAGARAKASCVPLHPAMRAGSPAPARRRRSPEDTKRFISTSCSVCEHGHIEHWRGSSACGLGLLDLAAMTRGLPVASQRSRLNAPRRRRDGLRGSWPASSRGSPGTTSECRGAAVGGRD